MPEDTQEIQRTDRLTLKMCMRTYVNARNMPKESGKIQRLAVLGIKIPVEGL